MKFSSTFFLLFIAISLCAQQKPVVQWSFESKEVLKTACELKQVVGVSGSGIDLQNNKCLFITGGLPKQQSKALTVEFWMKGDRFQFLSFPRPHFLLQLTMTGLLFRTTQIQNGNSTIHDLKIPFTGVDRSSFSYYTDREWHHFVFVVDTEKKLKQIWVDGASPAGFSMSLESNSPVLLSNGDGFRFTSAIDELKFYTGAVQNSQVLAKESTPSQKSATVDVQEYAPGYPDYTVQAKDQLKQFPRPRYYSNNQLPRNMSWMDIQYLHRELPGKGGKGIGIVNPATAVTLVDELASNWNYYVEIPLLRTTATAASKAYSNTNHIAGALINYANQRPDLPTALITVQAQNIPSLMWSQQLPPQYYMKDAKGKFILRGNRKLHSPLMPLDIVEKDAAVSAGYIQQLIKYLKQPPALINENGEIFGHIIREDYLKKDPAVWKDFKSSGLSASQYSGRFQYRQDSTYRRIILQRISEKAHFSFYNVSAIQPVYWPDYATRRKVNQWDESIIYPTPDFYPSTPDNWAIGRSSLNGFGIISEGRKKEIQLGDRFFSPFVSAGWGAEEKNIRPAQWLALLKSMIMLGADFFYTGYFNITGKNGKWPDGFGPNDPRGYIYQAAMPSYAQAIRSWVPEFFTQGQLLDPGDYADARQGFRFKGLAENELILVRKWNNRYLIYGSIQPSSNLKGNIPAQIATQIKLEDKILEFEIRKQGSLFVLDLSGKDPLFYQLDQWHQAEHPYFWSTFTQQEAVVFESSDGPVKRVTTNYQGFNFTKSRSHMVMEPTGTVRYDGLSVKPGRYLVVLEGKALKPGTQIELVIPATGFVKRIVISENSDSHFVELNIHSTLNRIEWKIVSGEFSFSRFSFKPN